MVVVQDSLGAYRRFVSVWFYVTITRPVQAAGANAIFAFATSVGQSGTAGYVGYQFNLAETSVGSGTKYHSLFGSAGTYFFILDRYCRPVVQAPAPTIVAGTGAGTGGAVSIIGSDVAGQIYVNSGTTPATNAVLATLTVTEIRVCRPRPR